jgi:DUF971 family protein
MADGPYPVEARRLAAERRLRLTWNDGHVGEYDYDFLRGWCPCAACQGHQVIELVFHPPPAPVDPTSIAPVGNYGLSFVWTDGHGTGIYRFDYLRALCPCGDHPDLGSGVAVPGLPLQRTATGGIEHVAADDGDDG